MSKFGTANSTGETGGEKKTAFYASRDDNLSRCKNRKYIGVQLIFTFMYIQEDIF